MQIFKKPHPVRHPVVVARGRRGGGPAQIQQKRLDLDKQHLRRRQVGAVKAVLLVRVLPACLRTERFGYRSFPSKNLESQNLAVPLSAPVCRRPGCTPCTASPCTSLLYAVRNTDECCAVNWGHEFCCQAGIPFAEAYLPPFATWAKSRGIYRICAWRQLGQRCCGMNAPCVALPERWIPPVDALVPHHQAVQIVAGLQI